MRYQKQEVTRILGWERQIARPWSYIAPVIGRPSWERAEVEFSLRLHGLWEGVIALPPPPDPPYDIDTMEPIEAPPDSIWRDDFKEFEPDRWSVTDPAWVAPELDLGDGRRLILDAPDPFPEEEWAVS